MDLRLFSALLASKALKGFIRVIGGGGTAAPGLLAEYIDPLTLKKLSRYYEAAILITGTNGKTTTSRLVGTMLQKGGISFVHNRAGSNLLRGIIGTLIDNTSFGKSSSKAAVLEVDEVTLPYVVGQTSPKIIVFNNLFRDQLDRYGEVEKIRKIWLRSLSNLDSSTVVVLNSDDHSVAHLAQSTNAQAVYFGIEDKSLSIGKLPHASDFTSCIVCNSDLAFDDVYLAHLGNYKCKSCGLTRPKPDVYAEKIYLNEVEGFTAEIKTPKGKLQVRVAMPGLYNVYNTLAAVSAGLVFGLDLKTIKGALESAEPAFGRTEKIEVEGKKIFIGLVKNPVGFNELLRTLFKDRQKKYVMVTINDLIADGRDISWLWDVDFEFYAFKIKKLWISGVRAKDLALRMKYTGSRFPTDTTEKIEESLENAIGEIPKGETLYILPTYTAMLEIKKILANIGVSKHFWKD